MCSDTHLTQTVSRNKYYSFPGTSFEGQTEFACKKKCVTSLLWKVNFARTSRLFLEPKSEMHVTTVTNDSKMSDTALTAPI